jgi:hypothetical protein
MAVPDIPEQFIGGELKVKAVLKRQTRQSMALSNKSNLSDKLNNLQPRTKKGIAIKKG